MAGLVQALAGDAAALQQHWFPLYSAALKDSDGNVRYGAAQSLAGLAQGIFPRLSSYFAAEPLDLAQEFHSRESLRQDSSLAVLLGISLLTQGYPETLSSPTQTWTSVISLLPTLKEKNSPILSYFSSLAQHALGRKGAKMENEKIAQAYREYFREEALPKKRNEPKHLLGYILLDFELSRWGLPKTYSDQIRKLRRSPAYTELLPILGELSKPEDPIFREAVIGFTGWAENIPQKDKGHYWGGMQKILESASRNRQAFKSLGLWGEAEKVLNLHAKPAQDKTKSLQQAAAHLEKLIPEKVKEIFHFQSEGKFLAFDEKEINVILYVARDPDYRQEDHPLNQALRTYFQARVEGESKTEAIKASARSSNIRDVVAPIKGRVFLSGMNQAAQNRVIQWEDALRHLGELAAAIFRGPQQQALYSLLAEIPKNPDTDQVKAYLEKLNAWMKDSENIVPNEKQDLFRTIADHLKNVEKHLAEEKQSPEAAPRERASVVPVQEVEIYLATDPIEILHLGWPSLENSCLDIEKGRYQKDAAGYLLHPSVGVIYIRDPRNPSKPLASVSVGLDPERKTLFLLSPIKSNDPYEFRPLVERFLLALAQTNQAEAFFPQNLYKNPSGSFSFRLENAPLSLPAGPLPLYSDLTGETPHAWSQTTQGLLLSPREEETPAVNASL